jgi:hypothetical protein
MEGKKQEIPKDDKKEIRSRKGESEVEVERR